MTEIENIDEAIRFFAGMSRVIPDGEEKFGWGGGAISTALTALREKRDRLEPVALTVKQICEMQGFPVFHTKSGWGIVGYQDFKSGRQWCVLFHFGFEWIEDLMQSGKLYAHEPGGGGAE
jgi:hypothetical protein